MVDENIRTVKGMSYLLKKTPEIEKFLHKIIFEVYILREENLCLNICYAYTTKQNNVKVKDDGWF